jgi:hypothetical protein
MAMPRSFSHGLVRAHGRWRLSRPMNVDLVQSGLTQTRFHPPEGAPLWAESLVCGISEDKRLLTRHCNAVALASPQARGGWVEPDLAAFPWPSES